MVNIWFHAENARLKISLLPNREAMLSDLYSREPRKGHATAVMKKAVEFADERGVTLYLQAKRYGYSRGLDNKQLVSFYEKFGFVKEGILMRRSPSRDSHG